MPSGKTHGFARYALRGLDDFPISAASAFFAWNFALAATSLPMCRVNLLHDWRSVDYVGIGVANRRHQYIRVRANLFRRARARCVRNGFEYCV